MRCVAVLAGGDPPRPPPGIDADDYRLALLEDVYEVAAGLDLVRPAIAAPAELHAEVEALTWPGTPIVAAATPAEAFAELAALGAEAAVLLAPDAPDLPGLNIGKLFRALSHAPAALAPATGDGTVALAARLPLPSWLAAALDGIDLDTPGALALLRAAADFPGQVQVGPGWHRLRVPADVHLLDPGLEGWENTRALLSKQPG